jgi:Ca-activated chloride channel homolog
MNIRFLYALPALLLFTSLATGDQLYSKNKKANQLYKKGEYQEALKMYDDLSVESPTEPKIKMNKGSALYQMKDLDKAEDSYNAAAAECKDKKILGDLYYNLGNIQYRQGEDLAGQGKQEAMEKYKSALENYIKALDVKPHDRDAKWNLQLASAQIKRMQNQQNQKQNQNDKNNKDQKQDQKQDQQKNQDQNNDNKNDKKDQKNEQQKQDEKKQDNQNQPNQKNENKQEQKPEPTPAQKKEDMKKEDAKKLLQLYSDDERDLNKKPEKQGVAGEKRSEKDW